MTLLAEVVRTSTQVAGDSSRLAKTRLIADCLRQLEPEEVELAIPYLGGETRQGALEGVMLEAVAAAAGLPAADVRRAATFAGGIAPVARAALAGGAAALARFSIRLMQPVLPMLAQPAEDVKAAMAQLGTAILEWKLDGARVQVHKSGDDIRVFTRNLNDVTAAVPEVADALKNARAQSVILDGEAIALRPGGRPHPFQLTMRRFGRKLDVEALRAELPLSVFFFDCLLAEGQPMVDRPARERHDLLRALLPASLVTPSVMTDDVEKAEAFYGEALARGHEGIMAKAMDAPYESGRRGAGWLKLKRARTLDLVAQTRAFLEREVGRDDWTVRLRPELVVEIAFNDLQDSPQYPAGLALRFARVKGYRPDKRPEQADTIDTVRRIYEQSLS